MKYMSMPRVAHSCTWCFVLTLHNVCSKASVMHTLLYEWHAGTKGSAEHAGLAEKWADDRLISSAVLSLLCLALNSWKGKFSHSHSSCLATETKKHSFHLFKCSHIPVSTRASRSPCAVAAHITFPLVPTSRFFFSGTRTSSKARNSSSFFCSTFPLTFPAWGACETGAPTEQKQEVKGHAF